MSIDIASADVTAPSAQDDWDGYIPPVIVRIASEAGVDLTRVRGTGPGGRIRRVDVLEAASFLERARERARDADARAEQEAVARAAAKADRELLRGTTRTLTRLQAAVAETKTVSARTAVQLSMVVDVDVTAILTLIDRARAELEPHQWADLHLAAFVARVCAETLRQFPQLNATFDDGLGAVIHHDAVHLSLVVNDDRAMLAPVVGDAQELDVTTLAQRMADLRERTRDNAITAAELSGGTFTVADSTWHGVLRETVLVPVGQTAALSVAGPRRAAVVVRDDAGESVAVRTLACLSLSYDNRIVDADTGAEFLEALKLRLEEAEFASEVGVRD
jgi:2-oxoglutarate dehydrogenase E2 component (dihydrolipoamide succinyltransferase)